jgi:hypothetical protein
MCMSQQEQFFIDPRTPPGIFDPPATPPCRPGCRTTTRRSSGSSTSSASAPTTRSAPPPSRRGVLVRRQPLPQDHRLQGHAADRPARQYFPDLNTRRWRRRWRWSTRVFSTNTFPSWERAHPYRYIAHNGEINTLRGNINWMHARQALFESELFGEDIRRSCRSSTRTAATRRCSTTRSSCSCWRPPLPHAMMMMIPEPWSNHESMDDRARRRLLRVPLLPDGAVGRPGLDRLHRRPQIGAVLDRNGLRPSRYYVTEGRPRRHGSEAGVLDIPPEEIVRKGRLQPGRMFLVDTEQGRIIEDEEIKRQIAASSPYRQWLTSTWSTSRTCRRAGGAAAGPRHAAPAPDRLRLHLRGPSASSSRRWRGRRRGRSARWATTPPLAVLSNKPRCSTTTSSSSSRRSRTRRSTASARRSSPRPRPASAPRATCSSPAGRAAAASS